MRTLQGEATRFFGFSSGQLQNFSSLPFSILVSFRESICERLASSTNLNTKICAYSALLISAIDKSMSCVIGSF